MKIGLIVLCRYNSSRLYGKALMPVKGKPVLKYIIERLNQVKGVQIIVATSEEESDLPIVKFCKKEHIPCYRGSLNNVAKRFLDCAKEHHLEYAIRINGDNIFTDPALITKMISFANQGYDFISNVRKRTFPIGMSVEIVKVAFYEAMIERFVEDKYTEHVTLFFYDFPESGRFYFYYNEKYPLGSDINLALDDLNDLERIETIINTMNKPHILYDMTRLIQLYHQIRNEQLEG